MNPISPPSKRRMQVEAWGIVATLVAAMWCVIGGIWMGLEVLSTIARRILM